MLGTIKGPLKFLPAKKADVSFMNDKIIIMKNNFLLVNKISCIKKKFKIFRDTNKKTILDLKIKKQNKVIKKNKIKNNCNSFKYDPKKISVAVNKKKINVENLKDKILE